MPKTKPTETEARIRALTKVAKDKSQPKKARKAAKAEVEALRGVFVPSGAAGGDQAVPSVASDAAPAISPNGSGPVDGWRERQDAEVARQWAHHTAQLADPTGIAADLIVGEPTAEQEALRDAANAAVLDRVKQIHAEKAAEADERRAKALLVIEAPIPAERILVGDDGIVRFTRPKATLLERAKADGWLGGPDDGPDPLAVGPGDALDAMGNPVQEARVIETDHGREIVVGPPTPDPYAAALDEATAADPFLAANRADLEKPADPVLENGNGQPIITYLDPATGKEKTKGYTRVTTYIDCLEDKGALEKWKMRTLLEGGAVELLQNDGSSPSLESVGRAVKRLDDALADIDRRMGAGGELLGLRRQELLKEHRDHLQKVAEDLLELGDAHDRATKGTNIHRLTEIVDNGQPLPASTSPSDRRDVEAYQAAIEAIGAEVLWTERRIVLDDLQVSGTMDRAFLIKLPGMQRRIRVVGDVKTGRIDYGQGKIAMQLALYARGYGYDWTKPTERQRLSLNQHTGLLIHLPQGEGRCSIYTVDLELAAKGLSLAKDVREWRNTGKRAFDLKKPLTAVER